MGDLNSRAEYSQWGAYCQSKLCNVLFANELQRRYGNRGFTAMSIHPGGVRTELARYFIDDIPKPVLPLLAPVAFFTKSVEDGASTQIYCAADPALQATGGGKYFDNCKEAPQNPVAQDEAVAKRLWSISEELTGVKFL